jgi:hypothetical protein
MQPDRSLIVVLLLAVAAAAPPRAQQAPAAAGSDLDALMAAVLARRDENWKKLAQYVLDEREVFTAAGPDGTRLYGSTRDYRWFVRDGFFIRSPLAADGVAVAERERVAYEARWLARQKVRDERAGGGAGAAPADAAALGDVLRQRAEPRFVSAAYFLKFRFEPGRYALVGREALDGREVLRIEYFPSALFSDDGTRTERRARRAGGDDDDDRVRRQMNKVSLVTLWVLPGPRQIVRYTFDNLDMGFLPGRSVVRVDEVTATMTMGEPFPGVWLPAGIEARLRAQLAVGPIEARYAIAYHGYRQADVTAKVRPK